MEDIIKRILDIDRHVRETHQSPDEIKKRAFEEVSEKIKIMREEHTKQANEKIQLEKNLAREISKKKLERITKKNSELIEKMKMQHIQNAESWISQIFERATRV